MLNVPAIRIRTLSSCGVNASGRYVLYWMVGARRTTFNFALDHAVALAIERNLPLVVLEPLRVDYRWASDRHHAFCVQGMADNARACADAGVAYHGYVEAELGAGRGLLLAYAQHASVVVTDDVPGFFQPRMLAKAATQVQVAVHAVDSCGLYPLRATDRVFPSAHTLRRHLQKELPAHLQHFPHREPLSLLKQRTTLPEAIVARWPVWSAPHDLAAALCALPIDHAVGVTSTPGGSVAARAQLDKFLRSGLARYHDERSEPDADAASGLSPYLHWGHISAHEVFARVVHQEHWTPDKVSAVAHGSRAGFWGMSAAAESFIDEFVTWRELGFNFCSKRDDYDQYDSLPTWAQATLDAHATDPRAHLYTQQQLIAADTHDDVWNAAQRQLTRDGIIHNYLRMLWAKKILEWSPHPRAALSTLIELNNRFALDGRDPNSYSGIFWCLGRYDRPWGPTRPIFGTIRYMSSDNTKKKLTLKTYLARFGARRTLAQANLL